MRTVRLAATLAVVTAGCAPIPRAAGPTVSPVVCAPAPGYVVRGTGVRTDYLGADPSNPELCLSRRNGMPFASWFGTWAPDWPGSVEAHAGLRTVLSGPPGTAVRFDTDAGPGYRWHETLTNEGVENIRLLGQVHPAQKIAHEREGFDGNSYHSVVTQWREVGSGMAIYQNYRHIAGRPEPGTQWDPVQIGEP